MALTELLREQNEDKPLRFGISRLFSVGIKATSADEKHDFKSDLCSSYFVLSSRCSASSILPDLHLLKGFSTVTAASL